MSWAYRFSRQTLFTAFGLRLFKRNKEVVIHWEQNSTLNPFILDVYALIGTCGAACSLIRT